MWKCVFSRGRRCLIKFSYVFRARGSYFGLVSFAGPKLLSVFDLVTLVSLLTVAFILNIGVPRSVNEFVLSRNKKFTAPYQLAYPSHF